MSRQMSCRSRLNRASTGGTAKKSSKTPGLGHQGEQSRRLINAEGPSVGYVISRKLKKMAEEEVSEPERGAGKSVVHLPRELVLIPRGLIFPGYFL